MGAMVRQLMGASPLLIFPVIAMVLFLAVFIAIVLRTWLRKDLAEHANLPLEDER